MIDLHMHTTYSDGSKTVEEILKMCEEKSLSYIAITDHNTCEAYEDEAYKNNKVFTGTIIKGCELNAEFQDRSIEILGYNLKNTDTIMQLKEEYYSDERRKKDTEEIAKRFFGVLDKKGIVYEKEKIRPQKSPKEMIERCIWEEIVKHEENKEIIGEKYFESLALFYRAKITNPKSDYFLNRASTFPKAKEVVEIIHKAGGKAFLAHPYEYRFENTIQYMDDLVKEVKLDGIECFHPSADEEKMEILQNYAKQNGLYKSGGSDYHGKLKPDIEIGVGRGNLKISEDILNWL